MARFGGKRAVITGAGSGIGRELSVQLAGEGCHVALCDVNATTLAATVDAAGAANPAVVVSSMVVDVADRAAMDEFARSVAREHGTESIDLLLNNAGVGGGESFVASTEEEWERTFAICWGGVYATTRAFMPLLRASRSGDIVNISSVNGFYAAQGATFPVSAYASAKYAVKGFTEALQTDLAVYAPHVRATLVMPGYVGTSIAVNTRALHGRRALDLTAEELELERRRLRPQGVDFGDATDDEARQILEERAASFERNGPLTPAQAAATILDGIRAGKWRILVGDDAIAVDRLMRRYPNLAYRISDRQRRLLALTCAPPRTLARILSAAVARRLPRGRR
jgi:NAD(P)-dependent dehydrogenase (short-subunit alcohol dehydrogenase family)